MRTNRKYYYSLDALRGIAALLVFIYHMGNLSVLTNNNFIKNAGIYVDLFFILSGFVIYHNYKNKIYNLKSGFTFIKRRFKRLYPLHVYTLLIMLALEIFKYLLENFYTFNHPTFYYNNFKNFIIQLFLLNSTPFFNGFNWNGQNWSISAEFICYIVFMILSIKFLKTKRSTFLLSFTIICLAYLFFIIKYNTANILIDFNFSFLRALSGFFLGICVYLLSKKLYLLKTNSLIELLIIIATIYATININLIKNYYFILQILFALLIFIFSYERGVISKVLKKDLFQKLGLWSFSIYLNHTLFIKVFNIIIKKILKIEYNSISMMILEVIMIIITIIYSAITYKFIEKKFYNRLK